MQHYPGGRNPPESKRVLLERKWGAPLVCDDGVTIAKELELKDPVEHLGVHAKRPSARARPETGCVLQDPLILIHQRKIAVLNELVPFLEEGVKTQRPLLIIAEDVEGDTPATLVVNRLRGSLAARALGALGHAGVVVERMLRSGGSVGLNAATAQYVDLFEAGIVDPTKVVRTALENAVSVASVSLLTEATG